MRKRWIGLLILALAMGVPAWAAFAPLSPVAREEVFEIPNGTHARRMAGEQIDILPQTIHLTLGRNDVLVFRNADSAPHIFGPTLIMPGQSFRLPFSSASTYSFQCTAHTNGQLNVIVAPAPTAGWHRLRARWRSLTGSR